MANALVSCTELFTSVLLLLTQVLHLQRKQVYSGHMEGLMGLVCSCFDAMLERAPLIPRNYIIDQTKCALLTSCFTQLLLALFIIPVQAI